MDDNRDDAEETFIELGDDEPTPELDAAAPAPEPAKPRRRRAEPAVTASEEEPRLHPILSNADVLAARAKAKARLDKERHAAAMKAVEEAEAERLRVEEGLVTGDGAKDELVEMTLDLAQHSQNITLNGRPYWHGFTYKVPRHVADTLRDIQAQGWKHQDVVDGKDLTQHYQANRKTFLKMVGTSVGVKDAPKNFAAEELRH